ncbi:DNA-binding protein [Bradyrhizobium sp. CB1717]|uniref:DNA-binding protein n=1 Tax=Bradyrhizobium sp. CB1717 TaxID=3039154 RepID=UPI0024B1AE86|nr:DNA-binding protein [Bradyrhizobium sp. CB1717]WFU28345.1 DNA-binding protein [Bradyrhizobium sp. CB1717]
MSPELKELLSKPTASVPRTGRVCFGLGTNAAYRAAKDGSIPSIKVGGRIVVPTAALRKMLGIEPEAA